MKKFLVSLWVLTLSFIAFVCFATSNSSLPDSFKVEVTPNEFTADDLVDLKITAIRYWEVMKSYEWYFDIAVIDANWKMLQSHEATIPDWWWWSLRLKDGWIRNYEKWLTVKSEGEYTVLVTEFTKDTIKWETKITVKPKPASTTSTNTSVSTPETTQTYENGWGQPIDDSQSSFSFPDSFKVEVTPSKFSVNDPVDLVITAMKNWKTMDSYEWNVSITVTDTAWKLLDSSEVLIPDGWWWKINLQNKGVKKYSKWLKLKKAGTFTVIVNEFTDDSIQWKTTITVTSASNTSTNNSTSTNTTTTTNSSSKKSLTDDEIIQLLNKKWITIHKKWQDFKPNKDIRRDEAAKMLSVASKNISNGVKLSAVGSCSFTDLDEARSDLRSIVKESCNLWLFKWSNHKFNPSSSMTNAQLLTVVWRMLYWMQNESGEHYAKVYIDKLTKDWYLSEMNLTRSMWDSKAKRWDIAKILAKIIK